MKIRNKIKKTIEDTKKEPDIRQIHLLGKQKGTAVGTAVSKALILPKDKVPEPCKSCGRSDFPERLHTHNDNNNKTPSKKVSQPQPSQQPQPQQPQPWLSPKTNNRSSRQRALSLDTTVVEPLALTDQELGNQNSSSRLLGSKKLHKHVKGSMAR